MMMAAIAFAAPTAPATDAAAPQRASDKGRAFGSTFSDATRDAGKTARADAKDKDRKDDRDDAPDKDQVSTAAAPAPTAHAGSTAAHARDDKTSDGGKADDKGTRARTVTASAGKSADRPDDADPAAIDTSETPADAAQLAPVLDALKQLASAQQASADAAQAAPLPEPPAAQAETPAAADPPPATAALLAARVVPANAQADAKPPAPAKKSARADAAADKAAAIDASAATIAPGADHHAPSTPDSATVTQPSAGQQLAAGGADRALDVAKQGAWLDGLARDIATTGDSSSTLRFQAAPTHIGAVQVEIARGLEGASVTLTASSESARSALADAKPQLVAEARAQGLHIASAQVDVATDSRQPGSGNQPEQRHDPRGQAGFASQAQGEGGRHGQSQTRSQPFAINQTADGQSAAIAEAEESAASGAPAGGMYA
jgi:hypothetical protein